jgi:F-type H+-transporting ATPase subunit epsilon
VAKLEVRVVAPEREIYSGEGDMVVAKGTAGDVGILPNHAPMLIRLAIHPVRILEADRDKQVVLVDGGFLHVTPGLGEEEPTRVDVLAEHAALPEEIDAAAVRARADELRRKAEQEGSAEAQAELAKALMRVEFGGG